MSFLSEKPIMLAAGGTGGHFFPAEALARELLDRGHAVTLVTDRRGQAFGGALEQIPVHRIRSAPPGAGFISKAKAAVTMGIGLLQARALMRHLTPAAVVGFGGYPSVPTVFAAVHSNVPTLIHEQNAVLGRANRMLAPGVRRLAVAFPEVSGLRDADRAKLVRTGNPVRPSVAALRDAGYQPPGADAGADDPIRLFVMGGSQGARVLSEVLPDAITRLPAALRARLHLSQQCRPEDLDGVRAAYAGAGLAGLDLESFFHDVPQRLASCHLAVTRAGASTVAELTCIGRPALLVPYPHAMDDHQTANARQLDAAGAAWMMPQPDFTAGAVAERLAALLAAPDTLSNAAAAAHAWGAADAASRLADAVIALAEAAAAGSHSSPSTQTKAAE